jgi:methylenetetrahydrofolate dehydrogenase (NADP+) / methenyltetrahydrofolate cyclohydrolase
VNTDKIIDGKAFALSLRQRVTAAVPDFAFHARRKPGLAVVLVGDDPASHVYVGSKKKATADAGMASFEHHLTNDISQVELIALVGQLNDDDAVDGILVQLPLPSHIDDKAVIAAIDPAKDVDGFHVVNAGRLAVGEDTFVPCTPLGCLMLLKDRVGNLSGKNAVVIGRSNIVGKPMAQLLLAENCTVTIAHSRTTDLPDVVRRADIVIAAVGRAEMVRGDWLKVGAVVIDVGINRLAPAADKTRGRLVGDVAFDEAMGHVAAITPVPGGVGPMTIACLLRNTLVAAYRRAGLGLPEGL